MAKDRKLITPGPRVTLKDPWVINGEGDWKDLFVLSPILKLAVDAIAYLIRPRGWPKILYLVFYIYLVTALWNHTPHPFWWALCILTATVVIMRFVASFLLKPIWIQTQATVNNSLFRDPLLVPLDKSKSPKSEISLERSILIGGESGSGKSNTLWTILTRLSKQTKLPFRLHVIDPAGGVELAQLEDSKYTLTYTDRGKDAKQIIEKMRDEMNDRLSSMKRNGLRKHIATEEEPLIVLVIDELLLLKPSLLDATSELAEILAVGRKALYIVIGLTQLTQKDSLGPIRDLFPQRVAHRLPTRESSQAILGLSEPSAHKLEKVGEGIVYRDGERGAKKFTSPLIKDKDTVLLSHGNSNVWHVPTTTAQGRTDEPEQPVTKTIEELKAKRPMPRFKPPQ